MQESPLLQCGGVHADACSPGKAILTTVSIGSHDGLGASKSDAGGYPRRMVGGACLMPRLLPVAPSASNGCVQAEFLLPVARQTRTACRSLAACLP